MNISHIGEASLSVTLQPNPAALTLFADAEALEDVSQQIVSGPFAGDFLEMRRRVLQIGQHEFF